MPSQDRITESHVVIPKWFTAAAALLLTGFIPWAYYISTELSTIRAVLTMQTRISERSEATTEAVTRLTVQYAELERRVTQLELKKTVGNFRPAVFHQPPIWSEEREGEKTIKVRNCTCTICCTCCDRRTSYSTRGRSQTPWCECQTPDRAVRGSTDLRLATWAEWEPERTATVGQPFICLPGITRTAVSGRSGRADVVRDYCPVHDSRGGIWQGSGSEGTSGIDGREHPQRWDGLAENVERCGF